MLAGAAAVLATGVAVLAPPALAEVTNPGFETDTAGWRAGAGTTLARVTSPTHTGAGAAGLTRRSGSGTLVLDDSPDTYPSLPAGTDCTGSAWVLGPSGENGSVRLRARNAAGNVVRTVKGTVALAGSWRLVQATLTMPVDGSAEINVVTSSVGTSAQVLVDDVSFVCGPANQAPTAALTVTPASGQVPLDVVADASGSSDVDGSITSYAFDFGDGTTTGPQPTATAGHTYTFSGTFVVTVTVTDDGGATDTATAMVTASSGPPPTGPVLVAAGDVACAPGSTVGPRVCHMEAVADLVGTLAPDVVAPLGDLQYPSAATAADYAGYDTSWGAHKAITRPAPGNHDYAAGTPRGNGYYEYFNGVGAATGPAGDTGLGYYAYTLGDWRIYALNSELDATATSAQVAWLRADLADNPALCQLAYWHRPRYSSGDHGSSMKVAPLFEALYDHGADAVLSGHDHNFELFAPQNPNGNADPNGVTQIVAGTGGRSLDSVFPTTLQNSLVRDDTSFGVLRLTMGSSSLGVSFVPEPGMPFSHESTLDCHT